MSSAVVKAMMRLTGGGGSDTITGNAGDDVLRGGSGPDMISGGPDDDEIDGGPGGDDIDGGEDDDELTGGGGSNMIDGGDGDADIASYLGSASARVNLDMGTADHFPMVPTFDNRGGTDSLVGIENVEGSHGDDTIIGDDGPNLLRGLDGSDTINGGDGDDTIIPNRSAGPKGVANVADKDAPDNGTEDKSDTVDGGTGTDTLSYEGEDATVTVNLTTVDSDDESTLVQDDDSTTDVDESKPPRKAVTVAVSVATVTDYIIVENKGTSDEPKWVSTIENVVGGTIGDLLTGDDQDNKLEGLGGTDTLHGGKGNDRLEGGAEADMLNGDEGDDMLLGGAGADTLRGGAGSDIIYAEANATELLDALVEGGNGPMEDHDDNALTPEIDTGMDIVSFAMVTKDQNTLEPGEQGVTVTIGVWQAEQVHGSPLADTIMGSNARDFIMGGEGDDMLTSAGSAVDANSADGFNKNLADVLAGQGGDDILTGVVGNVEVFAVHSGAGDDKIRVFTLKEDHLHFLDFEGGDSAYDCVRKGGSETAVVCTLSGGQTIDIETTGDFTTVPAADLKGDLNIVVVPPAS